MMEFYCVKKKNIGYLVIGDLQQCNFLLLFTSSVNLFQINISCTFKYENVQYLLSSINIIKSKKKFHIAHSEFTVTVYPLSTSTKELFCTDDNNLIGKDTVFIDSSLLVCDAVTGKVVPSVLKNIAPSASRVDSHSTIPSQPEYQNPQSSILIHPTVKTSKLAHSFQLLILYFPSYFFFHRHCKSTDDSHLCQHVHNAQFGSDSVKLTAPQQHTVVMTTQKLNIQAVTK
jgi:hypothetical protein